MENPFASLTHKAQRAAVSGMVDLLLKQRDKDRTKTYLQLIDLAEQFWGKGFSKESYERFRKRGD